MPVAHWTCPACTLFRGQRCILNSAPYRPEGEKDNQGTDHLGGKKHQRAMKHVGQTLLSPESVTEFFTYVEGPKPNIARIGPIQALKDYIQQADFYALVEQYVSWPWQALAVLVTLQVKDEDADRAIGLLAWVVRFWGRLRTSDRAGWIKERAR